MLSSYEKTLITHTRDSAAKFLNYEITTIQSNTKQTRDKNGYKGRKINGAIGLKVPRKVVEEKCKRYMRKGKPIHRAELLNESDYTIIATYQLEYRGLANYYHMAYNLHTLHKLKRVMEISLLTPMYNFGSPNFLVKPVKIYGSDHPEIAKRETPTL